MLPMSKATYTHKPITLDMIYAALEDEDPMSLELATAICLAAKDFRAASTIGTNAIVRAIAVKLAGM